MRASIKASIPHSWTIEGWPTDVYPNSKSRGKYIFRMHKAELIAAGAVCRVGRDLVFFGANYQRWLETKRSDVPTYNITANTRRRARVQADEAPPPPRRIVAEGVHQFDSASRDPAVLDRTPSREPQQK
jgi:hypothetical protein